MSKDIDQARVEYYSKVLNLNGFDVKPEDFLGKCEGCGEEDRFVTTILEDNVPVEFLCSDCRLNAG